MHVSKRGVGALWKFDFLKYNIKYKVVNSQISDMCCSNEQ